MSTSSTGRFWLCPQCQRHVPMRTDACQCGFDRTTVPVRMRQASTAPSPLAGDDRKSMSWLPWTLVLVLLGWIGYGQLSGSRSAPETTPPVTQAADPRDLPPPPDMVEVPPAPVEVAATPAPRDLAAAPPPLQPVVAPAQEALQAPTAQVLVPVMPQPAMAEPAMPPDPMKSEPYWRQRLMQSRERIRTAYDQCVHQFSLGGAGDVGATEYAGVRGGLVSALMAQDQLEEDARREGVPAGWVRFDFSNYPALVIKHPDLSTQVHPCSVPDARENLGLR